MTAPAIDSTTLDVKCDNFLKDNPCVYAIKAARKKIAIVRVELTNRQSTDVLLVLGSSKLTAGGTSYKVEKPAVVLRKLREFTWDFLLFPIIDFHPVTAVIELFFFLVGPLYNRRLKRQLSLLSDADMLLSPGETRTALLAFRGIRNNLESLTIPVRYSNGDEKQLQIAIISV